MMISPEEFISEHAEKRYVELLPIRDVLLQDIRLFEESMGKEDDAVHIHPSPEVIYQMYLQYLGKLCVLIAEKYNEEYVWGKDFFADD